MTNIITGIFKLIVGLLIITLLTGFSYEAEKEMLQILFDKNNPTSNEAYCFFVGVNLTKPYVSKLVEDSLYQFDITKNNVTNARLKTFANIGLLNQEPLAGKIYRYTLNPDAEPFIRDIEKKDFCFGRVIVESVDIVTEFKNKEGKITNSIYTYSYRIEGIPEWAHSLELLKINSLVGKLPFDGSTVSGKIISFINTSNGYELVANPHENGGVDFF